MKQQLLASKQVKTNRQSQCIVHVLVVDKFTLCDFRLILSPQVTNVKPSVAMNT